VLPDPTVRQVTLDARGARLILASDGVWDAVHAGGKGAAHRVRNMSCTKAASNLRSFSKEQRDRDDITIIVADFTAQLDARVPQALAEPMGVSVGGGAGGDNASSVASVMAEAKSMVRSLS
jgi:hypothetical protein